MSFARWQHHIRLGSGFPYAPLKAMLTKISKWSRIQDSFRITFKIKSLVVFAIPDIPRKFQKDPCIIFWVILLTPTQTDRQTNKQTKSGKNITSLAEVIKLNWTEMPVSCVALTVGLQSKRTDSVRFISFALYALQTMSKFTTLAILASRRGAWDQLPSPSQMGYQKIVENCLLVKNVAWNKKKVKLKPRF